MPPQRTKKGKNRAQNANSRRRREHDENGAEFTLAVAEETPAPLDAQLVQLRDRDPILDKKNGRELNRIIFYNHLDATHNFSPIFRSTRLRVLTISKGGRAGLAIDETDEAYYAAVGEYVNDKWSFRKRDRYIQLWMEREETENTWYLSNIKELRALVGEKMKFGEKTEWTKRDEEREASGEKPVWGPPKASAGPSTADADIDDILENLLEVGLSGDGILPEEIRTKMAGLNLKDQA